MTFSPSFGRIFSPSFKPNSLAEAEAGDTWWDLNGTLASCIAAYQPKGAANYEASQIDLTGHGHVLTPYNTPAWNATQGWYSNAFTTDIQPTQDTAIIVRYSNRSTSISASCFGIENDSVPRLRVSYYSADTFYMYWNDKITASTIASGTGGEGVMAFCGQPTSGFKLYWNGTKIKDYGSGVMPDTGKYINLRCYKTSNIATHNFLAVAIYSLSPSDEQIALLSTAMAAL
jgi:hypothetical protein